MLTVFEDFEGKYEAFVKWMRGIILFFPCESHLAERQRDRGRSLISTLVARWLGPQLPRGGRSILGSSSCPDEDPMMELQRDVVIVPPKGQTLAV